MGIVDNSIPRLTYKNGALNAERPQPYVDDIFDPLFNAEVRRYLNDKYGGNPFVNTLGGYSELTKNALFGHKKWGILGPGMGIWSAFGRSMDKADDAILGGITEATKGLTGQGFENPLENIFVKDEDYSGSRLLSAMANSFNSMSGGKIGGVTTPEDFTGVWNIPALGIDLATDPGIMGGATRRASMLKLENAIGNQTVNKTLAEVGDIMSKYDDIMANVAGNTVVPGMKFAIGKLIHQILNVMQHRVAAHWKNVTTEAAEDVAGGAADTASGATDTAAKATASPPEAPVDPVAEALANDPTTSTMADMAVELDDLRKAYNEPSVDITRISPNEVGRPEISVEDPVLKGLFTVDELYDAQLAHIKRLRNASTARIAKNSIVPSDSPDAQIKYAINRTTFDRALTNENKARSAALQEVIDWMQTKGADLNVDPNTFARNLSVEDIPDNVWMSDYAPKIYKISQSPEGYNPEYIEDLFQGLHDPTSEITPELLKQEYLGLKSRLARNDFENAAAQNKLLNDLGFDPNSRTLSIVDDDTVPHFQTTLYAHSTDTQKAAVNVASSIYKDFKKALGELDSEDAQRKLRLVLPNPKTKDKVLEIMNRLDGLDGAAKQIQSVQYVQDVENLAQILQKNASVTPDIKSAIAAYIDYAEREGWSADTLRKRLENAISFRCVIEASESPIVISWREPLLNFAHTGDPGILDSAQREAFYKILPIAQQEFEDTQAAIVRQVNEAFLNSEGSDFNVYNTPIDQFIQRVNEDLSQPLHGTQASITDAKAVKQYSIDALREDSLTQDYDVNIGTAEDVLGNPVDVPNAHIARQYELKTPQLSSEVRYDDIAYINAVLRKNPDLAKDPEFVDTMRKLAKYYQFHIGSSQVLPQIDLLPVAQEFNEKVVPLAQKTIDRGYAPFQTRLAKEGTSGRELQRILGYDGNVPERSPYWRELRTMLSAQTEGVFEGGRYYGATKPYSLEPVLKRYFDPTTNKYRTVDINPLFSQDLQRKLYEDRINVKSPKLRVFDGDVPLDESLKEIYSNPQYIREFITSDAGRKMYPYWARQYDSVKTSAPKAISVEAAVTEDAAETAIQTSKSPKLVAEQIYTPETQATVVNQDFQTTVDEAVAKSSTQPGPETLKNWQDHEDVAAAEPPHDPEPPKEAPKKRFNLFEHIKGERQEIISNASGKYYTTRSEAAEHVLRQVRETIAVAHAKGADLEDFHHKFRLAKQAYIGDVVHGQSFLDDLVASGGIRIAAFGKKDSKAAAFQKYVSNAVSTINNQVGVPFLRVHTANLRNGNTVIGVTLNWDLAATPKQLTTVYKKLNSVKSDALADFTLVDPGTIKYPEIRGNEMWERLERIYNDVHTIEADLNKTLGFEYDDIPHVKNVKVADMLVADRFTQDVYNGIDVDACSDFAEQLRAQPRFSELYGSLNSARTDKRLLGDVSAFEFKGQSLFTDDLTEAVQGTLAGGAFDNKNVQDFEGLFRNKNWNIHNNGIPGPDGLKEIYMPGGSKAWANTHNLACVAPKYNDAGRLIGFQRFDMLSEKGRLAAWNNPETVLLPESMFAPLDMILKRQRRMSNKVYRWINHHITVPYKFGVLMNPGFLLGNMSDAYLKQATTMSQKYGTTMAEELTGVYRSVSDVMRLNNAFGEAYEKFVQGCDMRGITLAPSERIPSLIMGNRRTRQLLNAVVDGAVGDPDLITAVNFTNQDIGIVRMWLFLNSNQNSSVFSRNLRDMPEVAEALGKSKYQAPTNIFDRIMKGRGEYNPNDVSTWGLFMNNPAAVKMMDTSEDIEAVFRSATILNDLRHQGMPLEDLEKLFGDLDSGKFQAEIENMTIGMQEAVDAMANANFDYESSSEFMNAAATIMPFPTFFLKNLAYWLQLFVDNPQYIDNAISVQNSLWGGKDDKNDEFQAEAKGRGAIPVAPPGVLKNNKLAQHFKGIYKPTPLNSMFGALNAINDPLGDALFRLHPIISTAAIAASRNPVTKKAVTPYMQSSNVHYRPYTTNQFEKNVKYEDPNFSSINYAIHRFNPLERTLSTALRTPAKIRSGNAQLSDFLPSVFQPDFSKKKKK